MSRFLKAKNFLEKREGFTIIEIVIAIFVLSIGIVGVYGAFSLMVIFTSNAIDRLAGTYLAQEGVEIIRNVRDTNWITGSGWLTNGLSNCSNGCEADYKSSLSSYSSRYLNINSSGFYIYDTLNTSPTKFKRKITINCINTDQSGGNCLAKVIVQVSWDQKATAIGGGLKADNCVAGNNCVSVEETLYNWYASR